MTEFNDNNVLSDEQLVANYNKFEQLCQRLGQDRLEAINTMLGEMGERIATAPASTRKDYHAAYPGGLVDHSLRVAQYALTLRKSISLFSKLETESVIFAALFHDFGKVGQPGPGGDDYYIVETSEWHREKLGKFYKVNDKIQWMSNVDHTFHILLHYGIRPTQDEYLAIRLNDGPYSDQNKEYSMREPLLAILIHMADRLASEEEKGFV
jgi:hypothetical protein